VQFRFSAHQNLSVERAVGLLAGLGAKLQIAVDALAEGARQLRGGSSLEMNHIRSPATVPENVFSSGSKSIGPAAYPLYSIMASPPH
jgi:hypothetical protein